MPPIRANDITDEDCAEWKVRPTLNPRTNRTISQTASTYTMFRNRCGEPLISPDEVLTPLEIFTRMATLSVSAGLLDATLLQFVIRSSVDGFEHTERPRLTVIFADRMNYARLIQESLANNILDPVLRADYTNMHNFISHLQFIPEDIRNRLRSLPRRRTSPNQGQPEPDVPQPQQEVPIVPQPQEPNTFAGLSVNQIQNELNRLQRLRTTDIRNHVSRDTPQFIEREAQINELSLRSQELMRQMMDRMTGIDRFAELIAPQEPRQPQEPHQPHIPQQYVPPPPPPPIPSLSSKSKKSLSSNSPQGDIEPGCVLSLSGINPLYRSIANKLKKQCHSLTKRCTPTIAIIQQINLRTRHYSVNNKFRSVIPEYCIATFFKKWQPLSSAEQKNLLIMDKDMLDIKYKGQRGVGQGVIRSFIQRIMDELTLYKVFIPSEGEALNRYFINPKFTPDANFKRISGNKFKTAIDYVNFYKFIGSLLVFITVNFEIGLDFHLSNGILSHMIYKESNLTNDDYIAYGMLDFPNEFTGMINLMRNPNYIEAAYLSFNDEYPLKSQDIPVTKENFQEYLAARYKYRLLHKIFPSSVATDDTYDRFKGLVEGFSIFRKEFNALDVTIPMIDRMLSFGEIKQEDIVKLIEKFRAGMTRIQGETTTAVNTLVSILEDNGATFPFEAVGMARPSSEAKVKKVFLEFVGKLLMFWSSYKHYVPTLNYTIIIIYNPERTYPVSHTCYTQIEMPYILHNNRALMYERLVTASYSGEVGIGNYGGGRKK